MSVSKLSPIIRILASVGMLSSFLINCIAYCEGFPITKAVAPDAVSIAETIDPPPGTSMSPVPEFLSLLEAMKLHPRCMYKLAIASFLYVNLKSMPTTTALMFGSY